ncbi:GNAT family N-acetyltransferase [Paenibacillus sp. GCM10027627]|uniref:GNAT family N-acetyltransferase n=1 Tax=unclassified Paenibacillus TaxID=185978 RepID=UPI00362540E1
MEVSIIEMTESDHEHVIDIDDSFVVDSILIPYFSGESIAYTTHKVEFYIKSYEDDESDESLEENRNGYSSDSVIFKAFADEHPAGQIRLKRNWNHFAYIEDIKVDKRYRRAGIGRKLMEQAEKWALAGGMPGVALETQNNNLKACKFYESCGFVLGGFDLFLYKNLGKSSDEIALYWYKMLN